MKNSLTIFVPAYNEEENLKDAVKKYDRIVRKIMPDYEIIIFDDGSADKTGEIADRLARDNKKVRVVHNRVNKGLGYNFRRSVRLARKNYYIFLTGEGESDEGSIRNMLGQVGKADIIIGYVGNFHIRAWYRRWISKSYTHLLNALFGLHLVYFNGQTIFRTKDLRSIKMTTDSFAFNAEALIRLLKSGKGYTYMAVPYIVRPTTGSSLFRIKNLVGVFSNLMRLFFEVRLGFGVKKR
jgi:glycosyltransferase involved in cell wall biosynthesis